MLLTDARRAARTGPDGELIPLDEQDRALWDRGRSPKASRSSRATLSRGSIGAYQLQAAIAAVHDEAARAEDTDWPQILALYGLLKRMSDNPMVTLNHAIAAAMVHGPAAGLELLEALDADAAHGRALSPRRGARATCSRWPATATRAIAHYPRGRQPDGEHARAQLPDHAGGSARGALLIAGALARARPARARRQSGIAAR